MSEERHREISVGALRRQALVWDEGPGEFQRKEASLGALRYKLVKETRVYRKKGESPPRQCGLSRQPKEGWWWGHGGVLGRGDSEGKRKRSGREGGTRDRISVNRGMRKGTKGQPRSSHGGAGRGCHGWKGVRKPDGRAQCHPRDSTGTNPFDNGEA